MNCVEARLCVRAAEYSMAAHMTGYAGHGNNAQVRADQTVHEAEHITARTPEPLVSVRPSAPPVLLYSLLYSLLHSLLYSLLYSLLHSPVISVSFLYSSCIPASTPRLLPLPPSK